jgi:ElaB/YqjD/DUF883 family membrane-anchored ribosome-binding protein
MNRPNTVPVGQVLQELTERDFLLELDMSQKVGAMILLQLKEIKGSMSQLKNQMGTESRDNKKWRKKVEEWMEETEQRLSDIETTINNGDLEEALEEVDDILQDIPLGGSDDSDGTTGSE